MRDVKDERTLWPRWVGEDTDCSIWLLGYDAAVSAWTGAAMALPLQGKNILDTILSEPKLNGVLLIMIGHSLGGLVIKMALANTQTQGDKRLERFSEQLKGIVFIGTPHSGSELATLAHMISWFRSSKQIESMRANDPYLLQLNTHFCKIHSMLDFKVRTFIETRGLSIWRRFGAIRKMVVPLSSGDAHVTGTSTIPLEEDHFSICKPLNKSSQIHCSVIDFIKEIKQTTMSLGQHDVTQKSIDSTNKPNFSVTRINPPSDIVDAWRRKSSAVHLALSVYGIETEARVAVSAWITTDEPQVLLEQIADWHKQLSRDSLIPVNLRHRTESSTLKQLVEDMPSTRQRMLEWLSVTPFSAYVYFNDTYILPGFDKAILREQLLVEPLIHRLSKNSERIVHIQTDLKNIDGALASAIVKVKERFHRIVETPKISDTEFRSLSELAQLVAWATAQHLERPEDGDATMVFESLRTRIRFAQNIATGARHTRDENPLP